MERLKRSYRCGDAVQQAISRRTASGDSAAVDYQPALELLVLPLSGDDRDVVDCVVVQEVRKVR